MDSFEVDPYPGKPKILFVGLAHSTHTLSWIDLLSQSELNVRLFAMPNGGMPPTDWRVRTYLPQMTLQLSSDLDSAVRQTLYPVLGEKNIPKWKPVYIGILALRRILKFLKMPFELSIAYSPRNKMGLRSSDADAPSDWLATVIKDWKPDIIHTLGIYDEQGGLFYYQCRKKHQLEKYGKWVLQLRGGSDLTLRKHNPALSSQIQEMLTECDSIITDNLANVDYIKGLNLPDTKIANIAPVPGTGGIDVDYFTSLWNKLPSQRERIILWPKAYESMWSKALPVFEALKICWEDIQPCEIYMLAVNSEVKTWYWALPSHIREHCHLYNRIERFKVFELLVKARVMLAPSLIDGVPNVLYESMACGVFPILSPLDTITPVVKHAENVLFACNLYPQEISEALTRAMTDDDFVDQCAQANLRLVRKLADRRNIAGQIINYYESLAK